MPQTKEEKAATNKKWRENNKEKIAEKREEKAAYDKERNQKNKEKNAERKKEYYQKNREHILEQTAKNCIANRKREAEYRQTPSGIRSRIVSGWKAAGITPPIGLTLFDVYDNIYLPCTHCMVCKNEFRNSYDKNCDHNHDLVENNFRNVLCRDCNTMDRWRNKI